MDPFLYERVVRLSRVISRHRRKNFKFGFQPLTSDFEPVARMRIREETGDGRHHSYLLVLPCSYSLQRPAACVKLDLHTTAPRV
jgi:hypothetical protein